jgi:hypothetical protein
MGCLTDKVKLTRALVQDLDEVVKEVKLLGEHEEESSLKITELEALCKKLREDTQRMEEEKATLEGMVESHDELLMETTRETGLDCMGEDEDDVEEEEDADDGGDAAAPPTTTPPPSAPPAAVPMEIDEEGWRMTLMIWMMTRAKATLTWMSSFPMMNIMIGIESLSLCLRTRIKNKF